MANGWAAHMAAARTLSHNPDYTNQVQGWSSIAENVGVGGSANAVEQALEGSAEHREHLLSTTLTEVGYGTAVASDGSLYVDEVFRRPSGGACAAESTGPPPAVSAPAPPDPGTLAAPPVSAPVSAPVDQAAQARAALRAALWTASHAPPVTGAVALEFGYWQLLRALPMR